MTQEVNTLHQFTAGGYRHPSRLPSTLLMKAQRQSKSTLAGPIIDPGEPTSACLIAEKTARSSKLSPHHYHVLCPQLISQHPAAETSATLIGCSPGTNAGSPLHKAHLGLQILVEYP